MVKKNGAAGTPEQSAPVQSLHRIYGMPGHLVRRLHQIGDAIFQESTKDFGLTPIQYATLCVADTYPGIDQRTLGSMVAYDRSTIGDVIQRLEQRGLLERRDGVDRRTKSVRITWEGIRTIEAMDKLVLESQLKILSPLSDGEQVIFMFLLSKLVNVNSYNGLGPPSAGASQNIHRIMKGFLKSSFTRTGPSSFAEPPSDKPADPPSEA